MSDEIKSDLYYERIKKKFQQERDVRLAYRPEGLEQYTSDFSGALSSYAIDPFLKDKVERDPITDYSEVLFIGGGFSALLTSVRLLQSGVRDIRIVERGADFGGAWYWNRYPGVACDVLAYDYLPLLDEMDYIPPRNYSSGEEILEHCKAIAKKYGMYDRAVLNTTVQSTVWNAQDQLWEIRTDHDDCMRAQFVICANGTLSQPKLSKIEGMESFQGHAFHSSRWDYDYTGQKLEHLSDKVVGVIGTGASAVQIIPEVAKTAKELFVFQRTPSSIDIREDRPTDRKWAASLEPGWQSVRRAQAIELSEMSLFQRMSTAKSLNSIDYFNQAKQTMENDDSASLSKAERIRAQETANIDYMMTIHKHIDEVVHDSATAEALKPWYMFMCKRPCFSNEYLPSFNLPNVHLIDTHGKGVTKITPDGPCFEGNTFTVDLLIYATGFEVQKTGIYNQIVGEDGLELNEKYSSGVRTLFGIHTHGFPNLFIMGGYQASYQFNLTEMLQAQGDHIAECIDYMRQKNLRTMNPLKTKEEFWVGEVIKHRGKTSWNEECTPGYYNFEGASKRRQDGNYNGRFRRYIEHLNTAQANMQEFFSFNAPVLSDRIGGIHDVQE